MKSILAFLLALAVLTWQLSAQTSSQLGTKSSSQTVPSTTLDAELANAKFGSGMTIMGGGRSGEPFKGDCIATANGKGDVNIVQTQDGSIQAPKCGYQARVRWNLTYLRVRAHYVELTRSSSFGHVFSSHRFPVSPAWKKPCTCCSKPECITR